MTELKDFVEVRDQRVAFMFAIDNNLNFALSGST